MLADVFFPVPGIETWIGTLPKTVVVENERFGPAEVLTEGVGIRAGLGTTGLLTVSCRS